MEKDKELKLIGFDDIELQGFTDIELHFEDIELEHFDVKLTPMMLVDDQDLEKIVNDLMQLGYITNTKPATTIVKELRNKWKKG